MTIPTKKNSMTADKDFDWVVIVEMDVQEDQGASPSTCADSEHGLDLESTDTATGHPCSQNKDSSASRASDDDFAPEDKAVRPGLLAFQSMSPGAVDPITKLIMLADALKKTNTLLAAKKDEAEEGKKVCEEFKKHGEGDSTS